MIYGSLCTLNNCSNFCFLAPFPRKALKEGRFFDGVQAINGCMEAYAKVQSAVKRWFGELLSNPVRDVSPGLGMYGSTINLGILGMIVE